MLGKFSNIKPFATRSYPKIFDMPATSSIGLVGNSGCLTTANNGAQIDSHDIIIRFNHAVVNTFEKFVGHRTDARVVNGHCFAGTTSVEKHPAARKDFLPTLPRHDIICKTWNAKEFQQGIMHNINIHNVYFLKPEFAQQINKYTSGQEATAGLVTLMLALTKFNFVHMYGFSFGSTKQYAYHYWEDVKQYSQPHSWDAEEKFIKQLESSGKVKVH